MLLISILHACFALGQDVGAKGLDLDSVVQYLAELIVPYRAGKRRRFGRNVWSLFDRFGHGAVIGTQPFDCGVEKCGDLFEPGFLRRAYAALPGRPLLGTDAELFGAAFAAAAAGEFVNTALANIGGNGFAKMQGDFAHVQPFVVGRCLRHYEGRQSLALAGCRPHKKGGQSGRERQEDDQIPLNPQPLPDRRQIKRQAR